MLASACRKDRVTIHDQQTIPDIDDVCDEAEEAQRQVLPGLLILLATHFLCNAVPQEGISSQHTHHHSLDRQS